jgi:hypothetical protein
MLQLVGILEAAASFLGLMSFTLEVKDAKRYAPARSRQPRLNEPRGEADRSQNRLSD